MKYEEHIIVSNNGEHYHTEIKIGKHIVVSDEPKDEGGTDTGPRPHQIFLASLGSCMAITARMYADRKEWKAETIRVHLNMEKFKDSNGETTKIFTKVEFTGDLSEEQIQRLTEISHRCPVHKTLTSHISIEEMK